MTTKVEIFTDGACKGNPGTGGWGALLVADGGHEKEIFGGEPNTTNNRMELRAVIEALGVLNRPCHVVLHTDSQYVQKGISRMDPRLEGARLEDLDQGTGQERRPVEGARRRPAAARGRMALGARPQRPSRQRARRRAGQHGRGLGAALTTLPGTAIISLRFFTNSYV